MQSIREIVQTALDTGYLSREAEDQLRHLLQMTSYDLDEIHAFLLLQEAACRGVVKQESREPNRFEV
jgi:hypothetical protein